jgi:hypothetical protein
VAVACVSGLVPAVEFVQVDLEWFELVPLVVLRGTEGADERTVGAVAVEADEVDLLALVVALSALHVLYYVRRRLRLHIIKDLLSSLL